MIRIVRRSHLDSEELAAVDEMLDAAAAVDGHAPLDEQRWLELQEGGGKDFSALLGWAPGDDVAAYAQMHQGDRGWSLAMAVDPRHRLAGIDIAEQLASQVRAVVGEGGGGKLEMWASQPRPEHERMAVALGLAAGRVLYQMRRPLPVDEPFDLQTRPFRPGTDELAWLRVNNRAFAGHPEQGAWDLATLRDHEALPWFDPEGFRIYEIDGSIAGFCWTKVHAEAEPIMGEIYVIAADPDQAGHGLGRRLTLAGLDHLARAGIGLGMLYVDADNLRAVKLYVGMGFVVHHIDVVYSGEVPPAP